jgi:hypothetical protein
MDLQLNDLLFDQQYRLSNDQIKLLQIPVDDLKLSDSDKILTLKSCQDSVFLVRYIGDSRYNLTRRRPPIHLDPNKFITPIDLEFDQWYLVSNKQIHNLNENFKHESKLWEDSVFDTKLIDQERQLLRRRSITAKNRANSASSVKSRCVVS